MKRKYVYLVSLSAFFFLACQENSLLNGIDPKLDYVDEDYLQGYVYPLSDSFKKMIETRSINEELFEYNWENYDTITTASGLKVYTPWSQLSQDGNLTLEISKDIKKEDGWELIFHSFVPTSIVSEHERNYLIFHNIKTGMLKVFYYLEGAGFPNNTAIWRMEFEGAQKLLNFQRDVAVPISKNYELTNVVTTNMTPPPVKGMEKGWNCFLTEMSYDPNDYECYLTITAYNLNEGTMNLFTDYTLYSEGAYMSESSKTGMTGITINAANLIGNSANQWITNNIDIDISGSSAGAEIQSNSSGVSTGILGNLAKKGLNVIFNKIKGSTKSTDKNTIELKTTGRSTTTGTLQFASTSAAKSIKINFSPNKVGKLGVWNFNVQPTVILSENMHFESPGFDYHTYRHDGILTFENMLDYNVNPKLSRSLKRYWVDYKLVKCFGEFEPDTRGMNINYGEKGMGNAYGDYTFPIYRSNKGGIYDTSLNVLVDVPREEAEDEYGSLIHILSDYTPINASGVFLKYTLHAITEIEGKRDTIINTQTFVPYIDYVYYID